MASVCLASIAGDSAVKLQEYLGIVFKAVVSIVSAGPTCCDCRFSVPGMYTAAAAAAVAAAVAAAGRITPTFGVVACHCCGQF